MRTVIIALLILTCAASASAAALEIHDAYYRPDTAFPQFDRYWTATSIEKNARPSDPLGGTVRIYVRNASDRPVRVKDIMMHGISLSAAVAYSDLRKYRKYLWAASLYWSKLPRRQIEKLMNSGWPVWWKFDPQTLRPGEFAEVIVRLRYNPPGNIIPLRIVLHGGEQVTIAVPAKEVSPRFEVIRFAPGRQTIYLYLVHPTAGKAPSRILLDGRDVTPVAKVFSDPKVGAAPVVLQLDSPLPRASFHCFQAVYPDGSRATSALRAYDDEFAFGMWGARPCESGNTQEVKDHLRDFAEHNINVQMEMIGSGKVADFMKTDEGLEYMKSLGIRRMVSEPGKGRTSDPWGYFIADEPDAGDYHVTGLPNGARRVGTLAQGVSRRTQELHLIDPATPCLINIDFTYRPYNYYIYGQTTDILASDPYYQARLGQEAEYGKAPEKINAFKKATYIEGVTTILQSSNAPKPVHLILLGGGGRGEEGGIPYATRQEKRIETYYSIGAGATGISYWWFYGLEKGLPPNPTHPLALAQWNEIGFLGAELRTAGPVITTSCPATLPVQAPPGLWVRTLLRGSDTIVLVCVNDEYSVDLKGIYMQPMKDVAVSVELPSWMTPASVFEVNCLGTSNLPHKNAGKLLSIHLGAVDVTRLILITSDPTLKNSLQSLYEQKFAANVEKLLQK